MAETTPQADDLLRSTRSYLSALHGSVARHDNLAANLGCAGCELRDQIDTALRAAAPAPVSPAPAQRTIQCTEAFWVKQPHAPHDWQQRPDASPVHCPGVNGEASAPSRGVDEAQQPETQAPIHLGNQANAEDCAACKAERRNLPYPFLCPAEPEQPAAVSQPGNEPS